MKKILLLFDLNKKQSKKYTKRKKEIGSKSSEEDIPFQYDKKNFHKKLRHACRKAIIDSIESD